MSYPDVRYLGDNGEATAVLRPAGTPADLTGLEPGSAVHYLATGSTTGGDYGLYRWDMSASPSGPGPHFHRTMSEAFFVLDGNPQLYDGRGWRDAGPGDFLHVPPGGLHGFRNESGHPVSMLILFTPGAPREAYFEGLNRFARSGKWPEQEELLAFFAEHDNHYV